MGRTPLFVAFDDSCLEAFHLLLAKGADVNVQDHSGQTPFHVVCQGVSLEAAHLLLAKGADVNVQDHSGRTPLHEAIDYRASIRLVRELIDRGADIFARCHHGSTPLDIISGRLERTPEGRANVEAVVECLLRSYAEKVLEEQGNACLHSVLRAADYTVQAGKAVLPIGKLTMARMLVLLAHFVSQNPACIHAENDGENRGLPLHTACFAASPFDVVRFLFEQDPAAVRTQDSNRAMAIHLACRRGASTDVLRYLAERDMTTLFNVDSGGALPVHAACSAAGVTVDKIKLLVEKGGVVTLQLRDINCATPLHVLCASNPSVDAVEYLAKVRPESVQEMTKDGDLPVIVAWKSSASEAVIYALLRKYPLGIIDIAKHFGTTITGCPSIAMAADMPPLSDP